MSLFLWRSDKIAVACISLSVVEQDTSGSVDLVELPSVRGVELLVRCATTSCVIPIGLARNFLASAQFLARALSFAICCFRSALASGVQVTFELQLTSDVWDVFVVHFVVGFVFI